MRSFFKAMKPVIHPSAVCYLAQALIKMVAARVDVTVCSDQHVSCNHSCRNSGLLSWCWQCFYKCNKFSTLLHTSTDTHTHTVTCDFPHLCGKTQWKELTQMNGADLEGLVIWFLCGSLVDSGAFTLPVSAVGWETIELCEEHFHFFLDAEDGLYLLSECSLVLVKMWH